ncbi:MAG TPA: T9SS type A sorting domain-containing protein, partial [Firmicutes bacterium]|nr:T9SS type A sorting domain-containing protein [Bacillota bacterium]
SGTYRFSIPLVDLIAPTTQSATYNVAVRIEIIGRDTGLDSLAVVLDTQLAPESLPHVLLGTNEIRVTHESAEPVDALLTYQWREAHGVSLPPASSAPIYPADGATDVPRDGAFRWTPVVHDSVNLYELEISEYPDMRYPIGPDGNRILWTHFTSNITSYTVPMPSRFESGRTYYWRVRAGKYNRWWGPWSDVWSVSFVGPAAPTDAHIDDADGLTLRWTPAVTGTQPAYYEVYADSVEDFIPETGGYPWLLESNADGNIVHMRAPNLIDTVHASKYPIDLASLEFVPAEFRVIAVDVNGTRSTFTAPIRLHPYAVPDSLHMVETGSEWRYRPVTSTMISRLEHMERTGYVERETDRIEWRLLDAPTWLNLVDGELVGTPPEGSVRDTITVTMEGASALTGRTVEHAVSLAISPSDDPSDPDDIPESIALAVTPNPFEVSAKIALSVPESAVVTISVYNTSGALVTTLIDNTVVSAREHQITWEPGNLASGVYFIRADIGGKIITARMLFVR